MPPRSVKELANHLDEEIKQLTGMLNARFRETADGLDILAQIAARKRLLTRINPEVNAPQGRW